jgi:hypothetical protein
MGENMSATSLTKETLNLIGMLVFLQPIEFWLTLEKMI